MRIGFLGLGRMGEPMAANLVRAGLDVLVWNRSSPPARRLLNLGARMARSPLEAIAGADIAIEMLSSEAVIDEVVQPDGRDFADAVHGRGLVHMSTTSPEYSTRLQHAVRRAGGWYIEAPVSGSRVPAEEGRLVAMVAGDLADLNRVAPVLAPMCTQILRCGQPPAAALMKLAVNIHLISAVTSLAEAWSFATRMGLDGQVLATAITSGQLASPVAAVKLDKLRRSDFTPQAAIPDVRQNAWLIAQAARGHRLNLPLAQACLELFTRAADLPTPEAAADMVGILRVIENGHEVTAHA